MERKISDKDKDGKKFGTVVVEYKIGGKYVTLTEGVDYQLKYANNINKGKATLIVEGLGTVNEGRKFVGNKKTTFKITSINLKKLLHLATE
ncbi:MAG: hypothetical protein K6G10_08720 [Butyrivibrio sp.]|nr:hypothetical protein [Butyrivibrio sp.]